MLERYDHPAAPLADRRPVKSTWHGHTLTDDFAWLKADNWREVLRDPSKLDAAIKAHLDAENTYADHVLGDVSSQQAMLFDEMKARIKQDDATVPVNDGSYAYYTRYRQGGQHPLLCRRTLAPDGRNEAECLGDEQVLLDGDALAADRPYFHLAGICHSSDHRFLAWAVDEAGAEFYTIRVRDLLTGDDLADVVPDAVGWAVWLRDATAFYYVRLDRSHRPSRVFRHRLGTSAQDDVLIYEEADPRLFVSLKRLQAGCFAEITVRDHDTSESLLLDLRTPHSTPVRIAAREKSVQYAVEHHPNLFGGEALVLRTNADGAEDFKICWTDLADPQRAHWRDLVRWRPGVYLLDFVVLRDWLIRLEREDGLPRIVARRLPDGEEHTIVFKEEAYALDIEDGIEFYTDQLRLAYSSMTTPTEIYDYDLVARTRTLRKRQEVPSGHNPRAYVTRRVSAPTADGEQVPISLLYRRDLVPDGSSPCLLYAYGAYGAAVPAGFNANRLSLVDRGFIYAIAHVRGGTDKGWRWYRDGKLDHKANSFTDFIAAAERLSGLGLVGPRRIVAHGRSAGGIVVAAAANMRPDLFGGILAEVPFVDVLNTMLDDSLPLTPPEQLEWGNPITDPIAFRTILAYSPYENVRAQAYPAILALAGLTDTRVTYWETAKWVARLRYLKTDDNLLALRTNMEAGHAGASGRFDRLKEVALGYAFALRIAGSAPT